MMTRRTRISIIVLILLILLLLLGWVLFVLFFGKQDEAVVAVDPGFSLGTTEEEVVPDRPTVSDLELEEEREVRVSASDVTSLAKSFVTRYGSYSNEANFANLEDVLPLMSEAFAAKTQKIIDESEAPEEYYGVSTSIVTVTVDEKDEAAGTAQVTVVTQREESVGSPQNTTVTYQEIILTFVFEEGVWKVDSASWQ